MAHKTNDTVFINSDSCYHPQLNVCLHINYRISGHKECVIH